jgi:hypothetical protein
MGFADLPIVEIAEDYSLPVEEVLELCDQLGIAYRSSESRLALEDAKALISKILVQKQRSSTGSDSQGDT